MKKIAILLFPIVFGLLVFSVFLFFLSKSQAGTGALQVTTSPVSKVYLNGKLLGKSPLCKCEGNDVVATGDYILNVVPTVGSNLLPYEEHITITKGTLTVVDRTFGADGLSSGSVISLSSLTDKKTVQLYVSSFPTNVHVSVDGNDSGSTPVLLKTLTDSDHDVNLSKDGYVSKVIHIHTVMGYQLNALVTLAVEPPSNATAAANFQINITPTPTPSAARIVILDTPTGFLRVRSDPSLSASETGQVKPGNSFNYIDSQNGWYEITLPDGTHGWVSAQYTQKQ